MRLSWKVHNRFSLGNSWMCGGDLFLYSSPLHKVTTKNSTPLHSAPTLFGLLPQPSSSFLSSSGVLPLPPVSAVTSWSPYKIRNSHMDIFMTKQEPARHSGREKASANCGLRSMRIYRWPTASACLTPSLIGTEEFTAISLKVRYLILRVCVFFVWETNKKKKDLELHFGSKSSSVKSQNVRLTVSYSVL